MNLRIFILIVFFSSVFPVRSNNIASNRLYQSHRVSTASHESSGFTSFCSENKYKILGIASVLTGGYLSYNYLKSKKNNPVNNLYDWFQGFDITSRISNFFFGSGSEDKPNESEAVSGQKREKKKVYSDSQNLDERRGHEQSDSSNTEINDNWDTVLEDIADDILREASEEKAEQKGIFTEQLKDISFLLSGEKYKKAYKKLKFFVADNLKKEDTGEDLCRATSKGLEWCSGSKNCPSCNLVKSKIGEILLSLTADDLTGVKPQRIVNFYDYLQNKATVKKKTKKTGIVHRKICLFTGPAPEWILRYDKDNKLKKLPSKKSSATSKDFKERYSNLVFEDSLVGITQQKIFKYLVSLKESDDAKSNVQLSNPNFFYDLDSDEDVDVVRDKHESWISEEEWTVLLKRAKEARRKGVAIDDNPYQSHVITLLCGLYEFNGINHFLSTGRTLLSEAIARQEYLLVHSIIFKHKEFYVELNRKNKDGTTPFSLALKNNNYRLAHMLLKKAKRERSDLKEDDFIGVDDDSKELFYNYLDNKRRKKKDRPGASFFSGGYKEKISQGPGYFVQEYEKDYEALSPKEVELIDQVYRYRTFQDSEYKIEFFERSQAANLLKYSRTPGILKKKVGESTSKEKKQVKFILPSSHEYRFDKEGRLFSSQGRRREVEKAACQEEQKVLALEKELKAARRKRQEVIARKKREREASRRRRSQR